MFNCRPTAFQSYTYAVLAELICTTTNERITVHDSFPRPFTARITLWTV